MRYTHSFMMKEQHIKEGVRGSGERCAVALVLREHGYEVEVKGDGWTRINGLLYKNAWHQSPFIRQFDRGTRVKPVQIVIQHDTNATATVTYRRWVAAHGLW